MDIGRTKVLSLRQTEGDKFRDKQRIILNEKMMTCRHAWNVNASSLLKFFCSRIFYWCSNVFLVKKQWWLNSLWIFLLIVWDLFWIFKKKYFYFLIKIIKNFPCDCFDKSNFDTLFLNLKITLKLLFFYKKIYNGFFILKIRHEIWFIKAIKNKLR